MQTKFTVVMAVYKKDKTSLFKAALNSIFSNSILPTSTILVVDGPVTYELNAVIEFYEHNKSITVIRLPINKGLAFALNVGLSLVETDWIIRADSDDINHSNRFETLLNYMNAGYDLIGSAIREVDSYGKILGIRNPPLDATSIKKFIRIRNPFNHMTVAYRTSLARLCGGYPNIYLREDYGLWALMIKNGAKVINISDVLVDASAGKEMYARRGGLRYVLGEIALQKHLVKCRIKDPPLALLHGIARSLVFLAPSILRGFIYEKLLRN